MSLIWIDGFDSQDLTRWTPSGTPTLVAGRLSGYGVEFNASSDMILRPIPTMVPGSAMSFGFAVKIVTNGGASISVGPRENTNGYDTFALIQGNSTGWNVVHYNGTGGANTVTTTVAAVILNSWEHFEVQWTYGGPGVGSIIVKRNGVQVYNYAGSNLYASGSTLPIGLFEVRSTQSTVNAVVDDVWVSTGELYGDCRIRGLVPTADVTKGWTTSTGTDHYALVDEVPASMTDYVSALGGSGLQDTYTLTVPGDLTTVTAVQVNAYGLKTDAGTAPLRVLADGQQSADLGFATTASGVSAIFPTSSSGAWTSAKLAAAGAIGIKAQ